MQRSVAPVIIIAFFAALVVIGLAITSAQVVYGTHAVERHGVTVVDDVRNCLSNNGPAMTLHNPDTGRDASVCEISPGVWGVMITAADHEITAFKKDKMSKLNQVIRYLNNAGYQ
jgi:hypothetical protein